MTENKTKRDKSGEPRVWIDQTWMIPLEQSRLVPFPAANPFLFFKKYFPPPRPSPPSPPKTPVYVLFCKPLLALLFIPQQAWRLQLPVWPSMPLAASTRLVSYRKGSPTLQKNIMKMKKKKSYLSSGPHHNRGLHFSFQLGKTQNELKFLIFSIIANT